MPSIKKNMDYHTTRSILVNENIRKIEKELPSICSDYFRSLAHTTTALTKQAYAYDLKLFFNFLQSEIARFNGKKPYLFNIEDIQSISIKELEIYQDYLRQYLKNEGNSTTIVQNNELGIARKVSSLRSFYKYLFTHKLIDGNIADLIKMPKLHDKPILFMEPDEVKKMIDIINEGTGLSKSQQKFLENTRTRDLAIIILLLGTGIRASELIGLDINDFNLDHNSFIVRRKGGDRVILYYSDKVKNVIEDYLIIRKKDVALKGHENALFLSLQKKRLSTRALQNLVKKYALLASPLKTKLSPHKLRATYGTTLYRNTGDIYLVADALGHADVNTTRKHYASISDKMRRKAALEIDLPIDEE